MPARPAPGYEARPPIRPEARVICGVITTRDVVRHTPAIVREFGTRAWLRCCVAVLTRRRTTFLDCVWR